MQTIPNFWFKDLYMIHSYHTLRQGDRQCPFTSVALDSDAVHQRVQSTVHRETLETSNATLRIFLRCTARLPEPIEEGNQHALWQVFPFLLVSVLWVARLTNPLACANQLEPCSASSTAAQVNTREQPVRASVCDITHHWFHTAFGTSGDTVIQCCCIRVCVYIYMYICILMYTDKDKTICTYHDLERRWSYVYVHMCIDVCI
jgi:hypothetical protein